MLFCTKDLANRTMVPYQRQNLLILPPLMCRVKTSRFGPYARRNVSRHSEIEATALCQEGLQHGMLRVRYFWQLVARSVKFWVVRAVYPKEIGLHQEWRT